MLLFYTTVVLNSQISELGESQVYVHVPFLQRHRFFSNGSFTGTQEGVSSVSML